MGVAASAVVPSRGFSRGPFGQSPRLGFHSLSSPPMSPLLVLIVAVLATTYAGPIVRFATAPAVAIAFWRLVLVLPVTFGLAARERQRTGVMREAFPPMLLSGVLQIRRASCRQS